MNKENLKNAILKRKFSIPIIIVLLIMVVVLFSQKQQYKFTLLYQYQAIPDIELMNTLTETQSGLSGEVRGFVKFNNIADQPKDLRQYHIIKPLNKFDGNLRQHFLLEDIIKMQYLPPKSLGVSELVEVNETDRTITIEDENGNQFFIDKLTKKVSMREAAGDSSALITSDNEYGDFIKGWLEK